MVKNVVNSYFSFLRKFFLSILYRGKLNLFCTLFVPLICKVLINKGCYF